MPFHVYAFDAYGTLFDVHAAVARHRDAIGPRAGELSSLWRSKQLEYTWVRTLTGRYRDFWTLTGEALDFAAAACGGLSPQLRAALMRAYEQLDAYDDVRPALAALRAKGAKTAILSNGTPAMLDSAVKAARLGDVLDSVISVDGLGLYKARGEVYQLVCDAFTCPAAQVSFQSSNRWDIAGAAAFGFRTVWINRTGQGEEYADLPAALTLPSLAPLAGFDA